MGHLVERLGLGDPTQDDVTRLVNQLQLSFSLNDNGHVMVNGKRRRVSEQSTQVSEQSTSEPIKPIMPKLSSESTPNWNIIPMWFFRYGSGMIGIPMVPNPGGSDWSFQHFAETYGLPWDESLENHVFFKPEGTLTHYSYECFFLRTKAVQFYQSMFETNQKGSFPLFPGTDMFVKPPTWETWTSATNMLSQKDWDLTSTRLWDTIPWLGIHLNPYGKALRFDVSYANTARVYYGCYKISERGLKDNAWAVKGKNGIYQIRCSQAQFYLNLGATM